MSDYSVDELIAARDLLTRLGDDRAIREAADALDSYFRADAKFLQKIIEHLEVGSKLHAEVKRIVDFAPSGHFDYWDELSPAEQARLTYLGEALLASFKEGNL